MQPRGLLFVFSGPSGVGKNTIMKKVMEAMPDLRQLPTATTRPPRDDEQEGREHEFLNEEMFRRRILDKALIEWQIIHDKGVYGVPRRTIQDAILGGRLVVADVDVLGAMHLKKEFDGYVALIFVKAPDAQTLEGRIRKREEGISETDLAARLRRADFELGFADKYDHEIINKENELDEAVADALDIICQECERPRPAAQQVGWDPAAIQQLAVPLVFHSDCLLQYKGLFPQVKIPDDRLPFETLRHYLFDALGVEIAPGRPDAASRLVDIDFEPPQLVQVTTKATGIEKNFIYVLYLQTPLPTILPEGWSLTPIDSLHLDPAILSLVMELAAHPQTG
jgi:guanylate kinase